MGPRGSGKSTWLRQAFPGAHTVNLLDEGIYQRLLAQPELFAAELRVLAAGDLVVVDEIQRLPQLLNEVHRLIEERGLRFILSGSSARKLKRAGVNLLAGRAFHRTMHPFTPEELGTEFCLEAALTHGLLPIVWSSRERDEALSAYVQMYLKEEIQAEALVRNLAGFARFLPLAALFHGQAMNVANVAREAGVARTTVIGHLEILEETLLCFRVPGYEAKLRVRERRHPKWYWCDPGLIRAMKRSRGTPTPEERGALFEGLVAQMIRAYRDYRGLCDDFFYWSPPHGGGMEVDFLLRRGDEFLAVEVKSGRRFDESWCRGLRAVSGLAGLRRRMVVYPEGPRLRTTDGIDILPFSVFSERLASASLWG